MASVFSRPGPGGVPRWFCRFKDASGRWRARRTQALTRKEALRVAQVLAAREERVALGLEAPPEARRPMRELLHEWVVQLVNRSAKDDEGRVRNHLMPRLGALMVAQVTLPVVLAFIGDLRREAKLAPQTQRHLVGLLSRFFSWAVVHGHATGNPVRLVPAGARPRPPARCDDDGWIPGDEMPRRLMELLPRPFNLAFYVGLTSGARMGEIFGLRLSDLDEIGAGCIRVRGSFGGPLKEDRAGDGLMKFIPAAADAPAVLGPWLTERRAGGAGPEDLVFPGPDGRHVPRYVIAYQWRKAARALGLNLSFKKATRTSFTSRAAARGVPIDQIAQALGHSSPAVTARSYQKYRRRTFDARMTAGLFGAAGKILPLAPRAPAPPPEPAIDADDEITRPQVPAYETRRG